MNPQSDLEWWKSYFQDANANVFEIINSAIEWAIADFPHDLKVRRDGIVERLYSFQYRKRKVREKNVINEIKAISKKYKEHHQVRDDMEKRLQIVPKNNIPLLRLGTTGINNRSSRATEDDETIEEVLRVKRVLNDNQCNKGTQMHENEQVRQLALQLRSNAIISKDNVIVKDMEERPRKKLRCAAADHVVGPMNAKPLSTPQVAILQKPMTVGVKNISINRARIMKNPVNKVKVLGGAARAKVLEARKRNPDDTLKKNVAGPVGFGRKPNTNNTCLDGAVTQAKVGPTRGISKQNEVQQKPNSGVEHVGTTMKTNANYSKAGANDQTRLETGKSEARLQLKEKLSEDATGTKAKNDARVVGGTVNKNVCNHRIDDYPLGGTEEGEIEIMEDSSIGVVKILNKKSEDRRDVVRTFNDANNNKHHPESKEEIIRETPRIKTILDNHRTEDQTVLDALMKLHSMNNMTVEILRMDGNSNVNMGSDDPPTEEEKCQGGLFHEAAGPFVSSAPMDRGRYSAKDRLLLKPEDIKVLGKVNPEAVEDEEEEPSIVQCRRPVAPVDSVAFMDVSSLTSPMASEMSTASGVKDALVVDKPGVKKMPRLNAKGILGPAPIAQTRLETPNKRATVFEVPSVPGYDVNLVDKTPRQVAQSLEVFLMPNRFSSVLRQQLQGKPNLKPM
ncbi:hypothetical protein CDL15_Pgr003060 [Punica granatum]|uniref:Uncharacterized protein n=1 Tax=Punica granatum TaxID=22663 RepID=A0A218X2D6_PUNGR|nr:hypothetical protein CDL15_Pgr003060 [Punica granatum]